MKFQALALDSRFAGRSWNATVAAFGWTRKWAGVRCSNSQFPSTWTQPSLDFRRYSLPLKSVDGQRSQHDPAGFGG